MSSDSLLNKEEEEALMRFGRLSVRFLPISVVVSNISPKAVLNFKIETHVSKKPNSLVGENDTAVGYVPTWKLQISHELEHVLQ